MAKTFGSRQLQRDTGYSQQYVQSLLAKGVSPAEIKQRAIASKERKLGGRAVLHQKNNPLSDIVGGRGSGSGKKYLSSREKAKLAKAKSGTAKVEPEKRHVSGRKPAEVQGETFVQASLRKEIAIANQRELEYRTRLGEMVDRAFIETWLGGVIVNCRDIMLKTGPELRDRIINQSDPAVVEQMITGEIERGLAELEEAAVKLGEMKVDLDDERDRNRESDEAA